MCAKQLYVKSNGQWVAALGGGGAVDTTGLATEQFVTDAIAAIPATDLSGLATLTDLNDALATFPESAITVHDGAPPQPTAPIPQALEEAFDGIDEGLHFFKGAGALVTLVRQQYQTTIVLNGPVKSVAKIVKSDAGLPTPQNPSYLVQQEPDGKWMKMTSDEINTPFGQPQMVDIFALTGAGADLTNYYTKPEVDGLLGPIRVDIGGLTSNQEQFLKQGDLDQTNGQIQALATVTQDVMDKLDTKADKTTVNSLGSTLMASITEVRTDTYTKKEVDDKLEADKDFSIANDNVLLASITSLQEVVNNLPELGTNQIEVLEAIKGVEVEPSSVKFTDNATSPIQWKGGLSLVPVKEGDNWRLHWNDGKAIHTLFHSDELTQAGIVAALASQDVSVANLVTGGFELNELAVGHANGRIVTQVAGGPENTVAYMTDLSAYGTKVELDLLRSQLQIVFDSIYTREESDGRYAKKSDNTQNLLAKVVTAQGYGFGDKNEPPVALTYTDTGEGYNERLVLATGASIDYVVMKSDLDELQGLLPRMERLEGKTAPVVDLDPYVTLVDADARYESKAAGDLLRSQTQAIFDSIYTKAESDARYYTQKQTDDRFIRIEQAFSKADFDNQMALFLYSRKQIDDKLTAINPIASPSINDPALADFKKSVLDSVALMLAGGGKQPPADIGWTFCRTAAGTADSVIQVRMIAGVMEFKGTLNTGSISGSVNVFQLPASFPLPELTASYPIAARLVGTNAVYTYANFNSTNRTVGVTMASTINEITVSGLRIKAAY